jgi:radical SAM superfamily enzyme YgiQ (UPF0313 family)
VTLGGEDLFLYEPLALEYVAAGVPSHHQVRILDQRLDKDVRRALSDFQPDVVGISSYTVHVDVVKRLFEQVKAWRQAALTVVGGHHATVAPQDFVSPFIDLIVVGEGVFAFRAIIERHEGGEAFGRIPGVAFIREGALLMEAPPAAIDLDALPFPDRKLTERHRREYYAEYMRPLASMRTSKGCPYRCSFCALWKLTEGRYLRRAPERIVEELAGIEEENVFFADDESLVDAGRMKTLARLIREAGIRKKYFLYGRPDTVARNACSSDSSPFETRISRESGRDPPRATTRPRRGSSTISASAFMRPSSCDRSSAERISRRFGATAARWVWTTRASPS